MTMSEFREKYGEQAQGLRLLIDELIGRARENPDAISITNELLDEINVVMQNLQMALRNDNLADWRLR